MPLTTYHLQEHSLLPDDELDPYEEDDKERNGRTCINMQQSKEILCKLTPATRAKVAEFVRAYKRHFNRMQLHKNMPWLQLSWWEVDEAPLMRLRRTPMLRAAPTAPEWKKTDTLQFLSSLMGISKEEMLTMMKDDMTKRLQELRQWTWQHVAFRRRFLFLEM